MSARTKEIEQGKIDKVKELIRRGLLKDEIGHTEEGHDLRPVSVAVAARQLQVLQLLLESGFSPNHGGYYNLEGSRIFVYPLSLACRDSQHGPSLIQLLIEYGARVDYPMCGRYRDDVDPSEDCPIVTSFVHMLHQPCLDRVKAFLDSGVDPLFMHTKCNLPFAPKAKGNMSHPLRKIDELYVIDYLVFHLLHIDIQVLEVLLNSGGIVPESSEPVMHSILFRYLLYASQNSNQKVPMVEVLLSALLETAFMFRHEEFTALLYDRYAGEMSDSSSISRVQFSPCNPDTSPIYVKNKDVLLSVDSLFVNTMWNLKIYVRRLEISPGFLGEFFKTLCRPKTLRNLSRLAIRSSLGRIKLEGKIGQLPLPKELRKYVYELGKIEI